MVASSRMMSVRATLVAAMAAISGAAVPATAQDCRLSVHTWPKVVTPGQSVRVDVRAHFHPSAFAFASAQMNVAATHPAWTFATAGAIAGTNVPGISVGQTHQPQLGLPADPSNPIRIWGGMISPMVNGPALVQVVAMPQDFWVYPSPLTSSPLPCSAEPGRDWIFVNPLYIGPVAAAPAEGTSLGTAGDRFIATGDDEILMALLLPAVQAVREAASTVSFDEPPTHFRVQTQVQGSDPHSAYPVESPSLNFAPIENGYEMRPVLRPETIFTFNFFQQGRRVATFLCPSDSAVVRMDTLPTTFASRLETQDAGIDPSSRSGHSIVQVCLVDGSVHFVVQGRVIIADRVEIQTQSQHNLKQIGLAVHSFESRGAREMRVKPILDR